MEHPKSGHCSPNHRALVCPHPARLQRGSAGPGVTIVPAASPARHKGTFIPSQPRPLNQTIFVSRGAWGGAAAAPRLLPARERCSRLNSNPLENKPGWDAGLRPTLGTRVVMPSCAGVRPCRAQSISGSPTPLQPVPVPQFPPLCGGEVAHRGQERWTPPSPGRSRRWAQGLLSPQGFSASITAPHLRPQAGGTPFAVLSAQPAPTAMPRAPRPPCCPTGLCTPLSPRAAVASSPQIPCFAQAGPVLPASMPQPAWPGCRAARRAPRIPTTFPPP